MFECFQIFSSDLIVHCESIMFRPSTGEPPDFSLPGEVRFLGGFSKELYFVFISVSLSSLKM